MNYELNIFQQLGQRLSSLQWVEEHFGEAIEQQYRENSWFTPEFCRYAISAIAKMLAPEALDAGHVVLTVAPGGNTYNVAYVTADNESMKVTGAYDFTSRNAKA